MSKSITILQIGADPLIVVINGDNPQKYQAGETYTVSDEVAAVIENILASFPQEGTPNVPVVAPIPTVADAGKAIVVGEDGKYELSEGGGGTGGGGGLPYLETITIANTLYGLVVHNMNENMTEFSNIVETRRGTFLSPSIIAEATIVDCDDVETDLELSNLVTYNSDGTTETYQGKHRVYVATKWFEISGFNMIAMATIQTSSDEVPLLLDIDTGKMVYQLAN